MPEEKIRTRYTRGVPFLRAAILKAGRGMVFDNSRLHNPPQHGLTFSHKWLVFALSHLPKWTRSAYAAGLAV